jgi:hypothetical protein
MSFNLSISVLNQNLILKKKSWCLRIIEVTWHLILDLCLIAIKIFPFIAWNLVWFDVMLLGLCLSVLIFLHYFCDWYVFHEKILKFLCFSYVEFISTLGLYFCLFSSQPHRVKTKSLDPVWFAIFFLLSFFFV